MKKIYLFLITLFLGTNLFAQNNFTCLFSANKELDKVQVKNMASGETKILYNPDNIIILQQKSQETAIETINNSLFLQQIASNMIVVNMKKSSYLNLTLYSSNGSLVARYSNYVNAGSNMFRIGATAGIYVLIAKTDNQSTSLKLSLMQNSQQGISEIITTAPMPLLKATDDIITFNKGDKFEFTGYHKAQTDVKYQVITSDTEIAFNFADVPSVSTVQATNITYNAALVEAEVISTNGASVTERGICWGVTETPTIDDNKKSSSFGVGTYKVQLTNLNEKTTYYIRAYAINSVGISYGEVLTVSTTENEGIVGGAIQVEFSVSNNCRVFFSRGNLQYNASTDSWRFAEHQYDIIGEGNSNISSSYNDWIDLFGWGTSGKKLKPYYDKGYDGNYLSGTNSIAGTDNDWGVYNSNKVQKWRTLTDDEWKYLIKRNSGQLCGIGRINNVLGIILLPDGWETPSSLNFTSNLKQLNTYTLEEWDIMQSLGAVFLPEAGCRLNKSVKWVGQYGYYWTSTTTTDDDGTGAYQLKIPSCDLTYTSRCYGNSVRLVQDATFIPLPNVVTVEASNVTANGAVVIGEVTADYGSTITERGVCWSSTNNTPALTDSKKASGTGLGRFTVSLTNLSEGVTYYVRSYAINNAGISYGDVVKFKTLALPIVRTDPAFDITGSSSNVGGSILEGNGLVTERGVCWSSTNSEPTIDDNKKTNGTGSGSFMVSLSSLSEGTTYYFRAYGINSIGLAYGETMSFRTLMPIGFATVETSEANSITKNSAIIEGIVIADGNSAVTERGFCWSSINNEPTIDDNKETKGTGTGSFTVSLTSLSEDVTYYVRAYAVNSAGVAYGKTISFKTQDIKELATVETSGANTITKNSAIIEGIVIADGNSTVTERGICWSNVNNEPTIDDNKETKGTGAGTFTVSLTALSEGTTYYVRAYAINSVGVSYGETVEFLTITQTISLANVITGSATNISALSADIEGEVYSDDNGLSVTERGICWSTQAYPTIEDNKITSGTGVGTFTVSLTSLLRRTKYYARAYAINSAGIAYGKTISFKTLDLPVISTGSPDNITGSSADILLGVHYYDNNLIVTECGVCWSSSNNEPTIEDNKVLGDAEWDTFINIASQNSAPEYYNRYNTTLVSLESGITYYARGYAISNNGIAYGRVEEFTTHNVPNVKTDEVRKITSSSATVNAILVSYNGYTVTEQGFCWSTENTKPTIDDNYKIFENPHIGGFGGSIINLEPGTTYYIRAYAINSIGIGYGETLEFTTLSSPVITDVVAFNITESSASVSGVLQTTNGSTITELGICWSSTNSMPTIADNKNNANEASIGYFSVSLTSLIEGLTYYARAYTINSVGGVAYGDVVSFIAKQDGAIHAAFSVSETNKVFFSKGNLQFNAGLGTHHVANATQPQNGTWRFAEHQWDYVGTQTPDADGYYGGTVNGSDNKDISSSYNGWIDLFGWATSGFGCPTSHASCPYSTDRDDDDYFGDEASEMITLADPYYEQYDWGVFNPISNDGGYENYPWRTLTWDEWYYIVLGRPDALNKIGIAIVNNVSGIILLPDDWSIPYGLTFINGVSAADDNSVNKYNTKDWEKMESHGAIFLPTAGSRDGKNVIDASRFGNYWSASPYHAFAYSLRFNRQGLIDYNLLSRHCGASVRLVKKAE